MTYETENLEDQIHYVLQESTKYLGAELGIISQIEDNEYTVLDFYSTSPTELQVGQKFVLGDTYCSITLAEDSIVDIGHMADSKYNGHPCYALFGLETYIGVPIWIKGERFGTLNFSSPKPRKESFSEIDYDFVFIMGQLLSTALTRTGFEKELKGNNEKLEDQNAKLEQLIEENEGMMHMMVHDLKAPINNIKILSQMITEEEKPEEIHFSYLEKEVDKASQIIGELNYYHKLEHSKIDMKTEEIKTIELVQQIIASFENVAKEKSIKLNLISNLKDENIISDKLALTRILDNLISNAIKFSPFERKVDISVMKNGQGLELSIKDEGPGLTQLDKEKLFTRFQMLSARPTNKEVSTGLGLAIVKLLSEKLDINIEVESELGIGTTFILRMPVVKSNEDLVNV